MEEPEDSYTHHMVPDDLYRTHEISIQCDGPPEEEVKEEEETKEGLFVIEEEPSDEDNFSVHSCEANNKVEVGIQTNEAHFRNVEKTEEFKRKR